MDPITEKPPAYGALEGGPNYPPPAYPPPQGGVYPPPQSGAYPPPQGGVYPPPQSGAYPPPQGGAYPPATGGVQSGYQSQPAPHTVVVQQPPILVQEVLTFGELPQNIVCPKCQLNVITATTYTSGTWTLIVAFILCLVFWPILLVPGVINGTKDVIHQCPNCHNILGHFKRM